MDATVRSLPPATPPTDLGEPEVKAFLVHLAQDRHLAPSTLAQALAALLFL